MVEYNPLVSIILPTYNRASLVNFAIESILNQTYMNWELLIIDDGSVDNSRSIVHNYTNRDNRIKYYYQENQGASSARNLGLGLSKGEFITFLDSDDLYLPRKIELQLKEYFETRSKIILCFSKILDSGILFSEKTPEIPEDLFMALFLKTKNVFAGTPLLFIYAELIKSNFIKFDETLPAMEDWDFLVSLSRFSNVSVVKEFCYLENRHCFSHVHSISNVLKAELLLILKYKKFFIENSNIKRMWLKKCFNVYLYYNIFEHKNLFLIVLDSPWKNIFIRFYTFICPQKFSINNLFLLLNGK